MAAKSLKAAILAACFAMSLEGCALAAGVPSPIHASSPLTQNGILFGTNPHSATSTSAASNSVLVTNGSNVPSLATALPNGITGSTQTTSDSSTKLATDAFVQNNLANYLPLSGGTMTGNLFGNVIISGTIRANIGGQAYGFETVGGTIASSGLGVANYSNGTNAASINCYKDRASTVGGTTTAVSAGDVACALATYGADGTTTGGVKGPQIRIGFQAAPVTGTGVPGFISLGTPDTSGVLQGRYFIDDAGNFCIPSSATATACPSASAALIDSAGDINVKSGSLFFGGMGTANMVGGITVSSGGLFTFSGPAGVLPGIIQASVLDITGLSSPSMSTLSGGFTINGGATVNGGTTLNNGAAISGGVTITGGTFAPASAAGTIIGFSGVGMKMGGNGTTTDTALANSSGSIILSIAHADAKMTFSSGGEWASNGSVATTMTSLGPTGSHTTVQEWLEVVDSSGNTRYIPAY